jgi:MFS family permease
MSRAQGQFSKETEPGTVFDTRVKLIRTVSMVGGGLFVGALLGAIVGLFVYANTRTPNAHDGIFAIIQVVGVLAGLMMGFLAARGAAEQDQLAEASHRAGMAMLKKYKPKPGANGNQNVGERVIGPVANAGEEFLKTLLTASAKPNGAPDPTSQPSS